MHKTYLKCKSLMQISRADWESFIRMINKTKFKKEFFPIKMQLPSIQIFYCKGFISLNIHNCYRKMELTVSFGLKCILNHLVIYLGFFGPGVNFPMILCHMAVGSPLPVLPAAYTPSPGVHSHLPTT